ncbi:MAG: spore coat U domain-containing protein [Gammaproteobacteria bacterium]
MNSIPLHQTRTSTHLDARRIGTGLLLIIACWLASYSSSFAACSLSTQTLTFGSINPQSTATIYTSGIALVSCTGLQSNATISACLAIGAGSAPGSTLASRKISAGSRNRIPIVIKSSPSAPQEIGTGNPYPQAGPITFLTDGSGSGSVPFPISISLSGPLNVAPGSYSNTFSGNSFGATYSNGVHSQCDSVTSSVVGGQMTVQATVVPGCTVTATPMDFGTVPTLTSARSATSTITLICTQGVTATIALDNGQTGTSPVSRQLRRGNSVVIYGVYQDSAYTFPWGHTAGIDTVSISMGSSTSVSVTAFGLAPIQGTPVAGNYTDVIHVTVTY